LLWSPPGTSRSSANALVMHRYASRSSTSRHHRAVTDDDAQEDVSDPTKIEALGRSSRPPARTLFGRHNVSSRAASLLDKTVPLNRILVGFRPLVYWCTPRSSRDHPATGSRWM
jgi:hypothetical protein